MFIVPNLKRARNCVVLVLNFSSSQVNIVGWTIFVPNRGTSLDTIDEDLDTKRIMFSWDELILLIDEKTDRELCVVLALNVPANVIELTEIVVVLVLLCFLTSNQNDGLDAWVLLSDSHFVVRSTLGVLNLVVQ